MSYEGTVILNYRLTRKLGEGGFGTVYLAEHTELGRKNACKILHREFASKPEVVDRFFREAKSVCAIGHRAIIDIENFGRLPSGEPFYLMEFFPGEALADRVQRARLEPAEVITVFDPVASALAAAHAKNIIHRDLKPENIMLLEDGDRIIDVKLLDFGIAKLVGDSDSVRSRSGLPMGTPSYMSPEQALDSKSVDARTDVYSFAATVYAAVAGRPPFVGESVAGVLLRVQTDAPESLQKLVPAAPATLQRALERCLDKKPANRPATIAEAWREIREVLAGTGPLGTSRAHDAHRAAEAGTAPTLAPDALTVLPVTAASRIPHAAVTTLGSAAGQAASQPRSRTPLAIAGVAAAAAIVIVIAIATRGGEQPRPDVRVAAAATPAAASARPETPLVDAGDPVAQTAPVGWQQDTTRSPPDASPTVAVAATRDKPRKKLPRPGEGSARGSAAQIVPPVIDKIVDPVVVPQLVCSIASFAAVYEQPSPSEEQVRNALGRLTKCRAQLSLERFKQVQQNLVSKL